MNSSKLDLWAALNTVISTGVVVFALVWSDAFAAPIPTTSAQAVVELSTSVGSVSSSDPFPTVHDNAPTLKSDTLNVPLASTVCPPPQDNPCTASADGSASSFADFGLLGALASGDASASNGASANFNNSAEGIFTEYITPTSTTLPDGTKVHANATLTLEALTGISGNGDGTVEFDVNLSVDATFLGTICVDVLPRSPNLPCLEAPPNVFFSTKLSIPVDLVIGSTSTVVENLSVLVNGLAATFPGGEGATLSVLADASKTAHLFLEPVEDFSLNTASGHDYLLASGPPPGVPEPGSLALLGIALGGLGFSRRRRAN